MYVDPCITKPLSNSFVFEKVVANSGIYSKGRYQHKSRLVSKSLMTVLSNTQGVAANEVPDESPHGTAAVQ
jgi:hypothetical protein